MMAWAVEIKEENLQAIVSEGAPEITQGSVLEWLEEYGGGYFVIDPTRSLRIAFYHPTIFDTLYKFKYNNRDDLFREVKRR